MKTPIFAGLQRFVLLGGIVCGTTLLPTIGVTQQLSYASQALPVLPCSQLNSLVIPASQIGMPTTGAQVSSAVLVPAAGTGANYMGEFCEVLIKIRPANIDTLNPAPDIQVLLKLPTIWNRKSMMFGGGAFNGNYNVVNTVLATLPSLASPLARGYAVFASDSGHQMSPPFLARGAAFAINDEALNNFAGDALKKTRDTAMVVIAAYYGGGPERSYFHGGSNGGREALVVAKKWPTNFDGLIVPFPALSFTGLLLQGGRVARALQEPGAYLSFGKRRLIRDFGVQICDGLDGVEDGVISNVTKCKKLLGTERGTRLIASLRCANGVDTGDSCLSDAQLNMLKTVQTPIRYESPLPSGESSYPGLMVWGSDWGIDPFDPNSNALTIVGLNLAAPSNPVAANQSFFAVFWDQWMRYFIARDPSLDSLQIDPQNLGVWQDRVNTVSMLTDANSSDLTEFHAHGGKLLMLQGMTDLTVTSASTDRFFRNLRKTMGVQNVREFARYYRVPGYGHALSSTFNAGWDSVSTLEDWVEHGIAPSQQIVTDKSRLPTRTRPLCEYPTWPRYTGHGDADQASSFTCVDNGLDDDLDDDDGGYGHNGNSD